MDNELWKRINYYVHEDSSLFVPSMNEKRYPDNGSPNIGLSVTYPSQLPERIMELYLRYFTKRMYPVICRIGTFCASFCWSMRKMTWGIWRRRLQPSRSSFLSSVLTSWLSRGLWDLRLRRRPCMSVSRIASWKMPSCGHTSSCGWHSRNLTERQTECLLYLMASTRWKKDGVLSMLHSWASMMRISAS